MYIIKISIIEISVEEVGVLSDIAKHFLQLAKHASSCNQEGIVVEGKGDINAE